MFFLLLSNNHWLARLGGSAYTLISGFGGPGVFLLAIADSSFLSFPESNDLLIVILSSGGSWGNMAYYVGMTLVGSLIGCLLLYYLGRKGGNPLLRRRFSQNSIKRAERLFERYGVLTVVIPSILPPPTPFKIFVLSAGVFRLRAGQFITAVAVGRTIRYSMWGILAVLYGNSVKVYMQNNLRLAGTVLLAVLLLAIAGTITCYLYRYKTNRMRKEF
jgi:membrane protein DedA with SNARE-associated domain